MLGNSRTVESQQDGVHEKLDAIVAKYRRTQNQRPVHAHTRRAFDEVSEWLGDWRGNVIFDSCCGVGKSTSGLAKRFPEAKIIGLDKSDLRVNKHSHYQNEQPNYRVVRADVIDFWRLAHESLNNVNWQVSGHFLLYPNPYPKPSQVQKRWHASHAMPNLMALSPRIEVRSNWLIYLQEFAQAAAAYSMTCSIQPVAATDTAVTPFEEKYQNSGQVCWQLIGVKQS